MTILLAFIIDVLLFGFFAAITWLAGVPMETRLQNPLNAVLLFVILALVIVVAVVMEITAQQIGRAEKRNWHTGKRNED